MASLCGLAALGLAYSPGVVKPAVAKPLGTAERVERETMEIVVRLRSDAADAFLGRPGAGAVAGTAEVAAVLSRFGVKLTPQHPGIADPDLASYFTITAASFAQAEAIAAALRKLDVVEAAYIQPPPSPA
jgi:hypothetical protein